MCKRKALVIGQQSQKNISLVVPEIQIQQKVYRQIKYEDTTYKIRIYEDCRSISLKNLKTVYHESTLENLTYSLKKQNQSLPFYPQLINQSPKQKKEERNVLWKNLKIDTSRTAKNQSLESETISALIENDLA